MRTRAQAKRGFILAEVIIVLVLSSVVVLALLGALIALVRGLQPQNVTVGGEVLPIAPTFGAFPAAVRLHEQLSTRVAAARAVYVFGGRHISIPSTAPVANLRPLRLQALPSIADFSRGLPLDAKAFYDLYAAALGELETDSAAEDFSVAIVGTNSESPAITCFVQVRRADRAVSDGASSTPFVVREVRLWDIEEGSFRYCFAERPAQTAGIFVGAVHTWLRFQLNGVAEEGPTCVVFPDPWVYGGSRGRTDDVAPFSRFSYFLAVSP